MKIIGIIGGMGPLATSKLYLKLTDANKTERPEIVIDSVKMNLEFEKDIISGKADVIKFKEIIIKSISRLISIGANVILIPCNTAHSIFDDKLPMNLEILSIVDATTKKVVKLNPKIVAILATRTTLDSKIYQSQFKKFGISTYIPNELEQLIVEEEINNVLQGNHKPIDSDRLSILLTNISKKSDVILLACTELSEIINTNKSIIDSLNCLAEAAIMTIN